MVVVDAVLAGCPVVTSRVSNALDLLGVAIIEAEPDNPRSYASALQSVIENATLCKRCIQAYLEAQRQFYNSRCGLSATLERAFAHLGVLVNGLAPDFDTANWVVGAARGTADGDRDAAASCKSPAASEPIARSESHGAI